MVCQCMYCARIRNGKVNKLKRTARNFQDNTDIKIFHKRLYWGPYNISYLASFLSVFILVVSKIDCALSEHKRTVSFTS